MRRSLWILSLTGCLEASSLLCAQSDNSAPAPLPPTESSPLIAPPAPQEGVWRASRRAVPAGATAPATLVQAGYTPDYQGNSSSNSPAPFPATAIPTIAPTVTPQDGWRSSGRQNVTTVAARAQTATQPPAGNFNYGQSNNSSTNPPLPAPQPVPQGEITPPVMSNVPQGSYQGNMPSGTVIMDGPHGYQTMPNGAMMMPQNGGYPSNGATFDQSGQPFSMPDPVEGHPMQPPPPMPHGGPMQPMPHDGHGDHGPEVPDSGYTGVESGFWATCEFPRTPRIELRAESLVWVMKDAPFQYPLVTTSAPGDQGVLRNPTTSVLLGDKDWDLGHFYGGRLTADLRLCDTWNLEATGFAFLEHTKTFSAVSDQSGYPLVAIPTIDPTNSSNHAFVYASLGTEAGGVGVDLRTMLWGAEANVVHQLCSGSCYAINLIGGVRYVDLTDNLDITTRSTILNPRDGTNVGSDTFNAHNQFYGGQLGAQGELNFSRFSLIATAKCAAGDNQQFVSIAGGSFVLPAGAGSPSSAALGNMLALPSNIGRMTRDDFTYLPEVGLKLRYYLRPHIQLTAGYDLLYWNSVVRATDQVDPRINPSLVPSLNRGAITGPLEPTMLFRTSDFWAQGVNVGISFCY